jgi:hypothetical protein
MPLELWEVVQWSAYWAPRVASSLGVLREWRRGDAAVLWEMAGGLPVYVGQIEREDSARAMGVAEAMRGVF